MSDYLFTQQQLKAMEGLAHMIKEARHPWFFGGSGVSTASGIPDLPRIYEQIQGASRMMTEDFIRKEPEMFYSMMKDVFNGDEAKPNDAHSVLARFEAGGYIEGIVTQNVDGLHQTAGSRNVIELHGNVQSGRCLDCGKVDRIVDCPVVNGVPRCVCGGVMRPDAVMFRDPMKKEAVERSIEALKTCDLLIIGGTSLTIYPATGLIDYLRPTAKKAVINLNGAGAEMADVAISMPIGPVLVALEKLLMQIK